MIKKKKYLEINFKQLNVKNSLKEYEDYINTNRCYLRSYVRIST